VLSFEWNGLRTGDHVLVHDSRTAEMNLTDGVVTNVDTHRGANRVGVRVAGYSGGTTVLWPSHLVVHRESGKSSEACWRCEELADRAAPPLEEPATFGPTRAR
jgi:hypothetical protein